MPDIIYIYDKLNEIVTMDQDRSQREAIHDLIIQLKPLVDDYVEYVNKQAELYQAAVDL